MFSGIIRLKNINCDLYKLCFVKDWNKLNKGQWSILKDTSVSVGSRLTGHYWTDIDFPGKYIFDTY